MLLISFFALWLFPTSSCFHIVFAVTQPFTSDRNFLSRGTLSPDSPNQILLSLFNSSILSCEVFQLLPFFGLIILLLGVFIGYSLSFEYFLIVILLEFIVPIGSLSG